MRYAVTAALALAVWPGAALAQTPEDRMADVLARARAAGIPVELLEDKMAEGRAKGVAPDRIAEALERRAAGLARAQEALSHRRDIEPADLAVSADALESGVSEVVLRTIADLAPRERRAVAIAALDYLVQEGQTPERALDRVREALDRGPEALLRLSGSRPDGRPPDAPRPDGVPVGARPDGVPAPGEPPQAGRPDGVPRPNPPGRP
jgi:hypothetical protein